MITPIRQPVAQCAVATSRQSAYYKHVAAASICSPYSQPADERNV